MEKKIISLEVNGVDFYVELRGEGPAVVLVPDGCNDCEPFAVAADLLADEFTVVTFDMRGSVRSMPKGESTLVTPQLLASDIAGIINALDLGKASIYGCSSGGQAVLSVGKYFPEVAQNLIVHEAALQSDTPLPNTGFEYFESIATYQPYCNGIAAGEIPGVGNYDKWKALGDECLERITTNTIYWAQYYLPTVGNDTYTAEELKAMPNLEFSVGTWSPSWLVAANITTAERGERPYTWLPGSHFPQVVFPNEFAEFVRTTCKRYL